MFFFPLWKYFKPQLSLGLIAIVGNMEVVCAVCILYGKFVVAIVFVCSLKQNKKIQSFVLYAVVPSFCSFNSSCGQHEAVLWTYVTL